MTTSVTRFISQHNTNLQDQDRDQDRRSQTTSLVWGSAVSSPAGFGAEPRSLKGFFLTIFSTQDGLSRHYNIVNCGLSCSRWGPRPPWPRLEYAPVSHGQRQAKLSSITGRTAPHEIVIVCMHTSSSRRMRTAASEDVYFRHLTKLLRLSSTSASRYVGQ